jgi:hypothetical protein
MSTDDTPGTPDPIRDARERAFGEFVTPGPLPESARLAEAEAHLLADLERALGVTIEPPTRTPAPAVADRPGGGGGGIREWFARLIEPRLRPALAVAAALAVVTALWVQLGPAHRAPAPLMRGTVATSPVAGWNAHPAEMSMSRGRVRLSWAPAPGATHYSVVFLAGDLSEIARVENLTVTELMLMPDALPAGLVSGSDVLWRVTAFVGSDEIARSTATPLTLPSPPRSPP